MVVLTQLDRSAKITANGINTVKDACSESACAEHGVNRGYTDRNLQKYAFKGKEKAMNFFCLTRLIIVNLINRVNLVNLLL